MAGYNEIQVGRYNRYLQKLLQMKGPAVLESLDPEMHVALGLFHGVENRNLEGWDRFGNGSTLTGQASFQSSFQWRNPPTSNVITVFEKICASPTSTSIVSLSRSTITADLTSVITPINTRLDARGRLTPTTVLSQVASGVGGDLNIITSVNLLANTTYDFILNENQEITLLPGDALRVSGGIAATMIYGSIWRERFLEESERT